MLREESCAASSSSPARREEAITLNASLNVSHRQLDKKCKRHFSFFLSLSFFKKPVSKSAQQNHKEHYSPPQQIKDAHDSNQAHFFSLPLAKKCAHQNIRIRARCTENPEEFPRSFFTPS